MTGFGRRPLLSASLRWRRGRCSPQRPSRHRPRILSCFVLTFKAIGAGIAGAMTGENSMVLVAPSLTKTLREKGPGTAAALTLPFALAASGGYLFSDASAGCGAACAGSVFLRRRPPSRWLPC